MAVKSKLGGRRGGWREKPIIVFWKKHPMLSIYSWMKYCCCLNETMPLTPQALDLSLGLLYPRAWPLYQPPMMPIPAKSWTDLGLTLRQSRGKNQNIHSYLSFALPLRHAAFPPARKEPPFNRSKHACIHAHSAEPSVSASFEIFIAIVPLSNADIAWQKPYPHQAFVGYIVQMDLGKMVRGGWLILVKGRRYIQERTTYSWVERWFWRAPQRHPLGVSLERSSSLSYWEWWCDHIELKYKYP